MRYFSAHDNGYTRGFGLGRFGGWFYLHVYYGIPGMSNFRWHFYVQLFYPRYIRKWVFGEVCPVSRGKS